MPWRAKEVFLLLSQGDVAWRVALPNLYSDEGVCYGTINLACIHTRRGQPGENRMSFIWKRSSSEQGLPVSD